MNRQHTHINRDNYEIWFIDHIDGQLTEAESKLLQKFLLEHPDLSIELDHLAELTLPTPEKISYPDKVLLKKALEPFSDLSEFDYQMAKAIEEGLSAPENVNISSPSTQKEWGLYQKTKLQATAVHYPHKNKLKHKRMAFMPVALRAVAAAILLLILFNVEEDTRTINNNGNHLMVVTETTPLIEHTPVLTKTEPISQQTPQSSSLTDRLVKAPIIPTINADATSTPELIKETPATLPAPKIATLATPHLPNSYETGLRLMVPKYVENHQLMASLSDQPMPNMAEPDTKTLLSRTTDLIKQVSPFNLTYNKIYDTDGELVAVNLSGDNFEVAQKVPKWWGAK